MLQIISGLIGVREQTAIIAVFSVVQLLWCVPIAYGLSISALVGQAIGSGNVAKAKRLTIVALLMSQITMIILIIFVCKYGYILIQSVVQDPCIISKAFQNLKVFCLFYQVDGLQVDLQSVIKALG